MSPRVSPNNINTNRSNQRLPSTNRVNGQPGQRMAPGHPSPNQRMNPGQRGNPGTRNPGYNPQNARNYYPPAYRRPNNSREYMNRNNMYRGPGQPNNNGRVVPNGRGYSSPSQGPSGRGYSSPSPNRGGGSYSAPRGGGGRYSTPRGGGGSYGGGGSRSGGGGGGGHSGGGGGRR